MPLPMDLVQTVMSNNTIHDWRPRVKCNLQLKLKGSKRHKYNVGIIASEFSKEFNKSFNEEFQRARERRRGNSEPIDVTPLGDNI